MARPQPLISSRFPYVPITVEVGTRHETTEALFDTGFTGHLVVPPGFMPRGARADAWLNYGLADGSVVEAPVYVARAWVGQFGQFGPFGIVLTVLGDEPIVGRGLMDRFLITLDRGARIIVEP